jgi:hypothetical protein
MIYIAHRGNIKGSDPQRENAPGYIDEALNLGYKAEVDLWAEGDQLWLGHDAPLYPIYIDFIRCRQRELFVHCKNTDALDAVRSGKVDAHYFFHQHDDYTLTSEGLVWVYPGRMMCDKSILVLPESWLNNDQYVDYIERWQGKIVGVCSDFVDTLKTL